MSCLLLYRVRVLDSVPPRGIGGFLVLVTTAFLVFAAVLAWRDVKRTMQRKESELDERGPRQLSQVDGGHTVKMPRFAATFANPLRKGGSEEGIEMDRLRCRSSHLSFSFMQTPNSILGRPHTRSADAVSSDEVKAPTDDPIAAELSRVSTDRGSANT